MRAIFLQQDPLVIDYERPVRVFKNWKLGCYNIMQSGKAAGLRQAGAFVRRRVSGAANRAVSGCLSGAGAMSTPMRWGGWLISSTPTKRGIWTNSPAEAFSTTPYRFASFVDNETRDPITTAEFAQFDETGVIYT